MSFVGRNAAANRLGWSRFCRGYCCGTTGADSDRPVAAAPSLPKTAMETGLQTLGWRTWVLILALIALVLIAVFLVTPAR